MERRQSTRLDRFQVNQSGTREGETVAPHDTAKPVSDEATLSTVEGRLLATMSLHAITAVYGEGGLRARLLIEAGRLPGAQRDRIGAALALMSRLHERDRRQREPYSCHPLRVTIRILSHYRVTDPDVACAALLHDTVEDHAGDIAPSGSRQGALDALAGQFGERAAGLVGAVTNRPGRPGATSTSSTGSTSPRAWTAVPGRG
jgi:hypothetical protein